MNWWNGCTRARFPSFYRFHGEFVKILKECTLGYIFIVLLKKFENNPLFNRNAFCLTIEIVGRKGQINDLFFMWFLSKSERRKKNTARHTSTHYSCHCCEPNFRLNIHPNKQTKQHKFNQKTTEKYKKKNKTIRTYAHDFIRLRLKLSEHFLLLVCFFFFFYFYVEF